MPPLAPIAVAVLANSSAVVVYTAQSAISITVQTFSIFAIRQVIGDNTFRFPYGAGKLEDFSAFLCGVLYVPSGLYMAYDASTRLVHPQHVGYVLSLIPICLSAIRMVILYLLVRRLARQTRAPSPLLHAYLLDYRVGLLSDVGVIYVAGGGGAWRCLGLVDPEEVWTTSGFSTGPPWAWWSRTCRPA